MGSDGGRLWMIGYPAGQREHTLPNPDRQCADISGKIVKVQPARKRNSVNIGDALGEALNVEEEVFRIQRDGRAGDMKSFRLIVNRVAAYGPFIVSGFKFQPLEQQDVLFRVKRQFCGRPVDCERL